MAFGATGEHVPSVALRTHETHGPLHTALQQTFCAEQTRPEAHSAVEAHCPPGGLRPHEPFMHDAFGAHCAFVVHVGLHAFVAAPHANGKQDFAPGVLHVPAPSHVDWAVNVTVPEGHVAPLQLVPEAYF